MKKIFLSILILCFTASAYSADLTTNGEMIEHPGGVDYVIMFNGISGSSEISYTGDGTNINWYEFSAPTVSIRTDKTLFPDNATGYILDVDGKKITIWVIDYTKYLPAIQSIVPESDPSSQCKELNLIVNGSVPELFYMTPTGVRLELPRTFELRHKTKKWDGKSWGDDEVKQSVDMPSSSITVTSAPLCNTEFKLVGDQYSELFKRTPYEISSAEYTAVAVECHITTVTTERSETNEADFPTDNPTIDFSAPVDVQFKSNANEPVALYYRWEVYSGSQLMFVRTEKDHRYTFDKSGTFLVKVVASNGICSFTDSIEVKIKESGLQVPKVFTPNGDELNDEFRVAYKSLKTFQCWVYNRWGRKVFSWTDPQKGWNGNYNGKPAAEGPYFYVIKAEGTDGVKYKLKGDVSLLR